jgi:hypothetical protein
LALPELGSRTGPNEGRLAEAVRSAAVLALEQFAPQLVGCCAQQNEPREPMSNAQTKTIFITKFLTYGLDVTTRQWPRGHYAGNFQGKR